MKKRSYSVVLLVSKRKGNLGYVTALFKLSTIFTVLLASVFLKEGGIRQRLLGSVVIAFGAVMLAL